MPELGLEYLRLYREAKYQDNVYQLYSKLTELARLDAARNVSTSTVLFVDRATLPQKRSNLRLLPAMIAGMLAFFMLAFVSFARERLRDMYDRGENFQDLLELQQCLKPWRNMLIRAKSFLWFKRKL